MNRCQSICRRKKRFWKRLIIECRRCAFKDGCSVLKLYIDPDTALSFKYSEPFKYDYEVWWVYSIGGKMQIEKITMLMEKIFQSTGLPIWAFVSISILAIIFFYFYIIKFPVAIIRLKKEVVKQSEKMKDLQMRISECYHRSPNYRWKNLPDA